MLKFTDLWALEKKCQFRLLYNLQAVFEPGTLHVTAGPLIHCTKFPYGNFFKNFKPSVLRFLQSFCGRVAIRLE